MVSITLVGPTALWAVDSLLDTGADDTVFPEQVARLIGLDLSNAPQGVGKGVGQKPLSVRYARVKLRMADNQERREWEAWVAFAPGKMSNPLLGFAGVLQYFTATFDGDHETVELTINRKYLGT
jgi:predicted aspartyl protease